MASPITGSSTASDLMALLNKGGKSSQYESMAATFASYLSTAINNSQVDNTIDTSVAPVTRSGAVYTINQSEGYKIFRDTVVNDRFDLTEDMFVWKDGKNQGVNEKGRNYIYQKRVNNAKPILPDSIDDCNKKLSAAKDNFGSYTKSVFEQYGVQAHSGFQNNIFGGYQVWGMAVFADSQTETNYYKMINSDAGKEVVVLAEEYHLYNAISSLAASNPSFAQEYNTDPQAAVDKYFYELGATMELSGGLPKVDTLPGGFQSYNLLQPWQIL